MRPTTDLNKPGNMTLFKGAHRLDFWRAALLTTSALGALGVLAQGAPAYGQSTDSQSNLRNFDISAQSLTNALPQFGRQARLQISANGNLVRGLSTSGVRGAMTAEQGLTKLLAGTGLVYRMSGSTVTLAKAGAGVTVLDPIMIQGARDVPFGDAPPEPGGFNAEYQTTATKMALPLKETPQAISVITRASLDIRQVQDVSSAVELTAGVSNSSNGDGTQSGPGMFGGESQYDEKFVLRGQPIDVRSDGFKVGNANADLAAYERVEVIKGPSGFYGQGSLGGFINLVRKKPRAEFGASLSVEAGSYNTYRTVMDVTGAVTEDENLRGRIVLVYETADSFVEEIENERIMIAPSLEAIINEKTRVLIQALYQKDTFDPNPGIPLEIVGDRLRPYKTFDSRTELYGATGEKSNTETFEVSLKIDHKLSDDWLASLLLQGNKASRHIVEGNAASVFNYNNYGYYLYTIATKDLWERDSWAGELRLEGKFDAFGREHKLLVGAEHNDQHNTRDFGYVFTNLGLPNAFTGNISNYGFLALEDIPTTISRDRNVENSAVYVQTMLSLDEKTKLLVSGRYDMSTEHLVYVANGNPGGGEPRDDSAFTKRIGLTRAFNDNISAYVTYGESFQPTGLSGRDGILDPITGVGFEFGFKTDWFDEKLGATFAIYRQDLDNRPITDPTDHTGQYSISAGVHRTDGIELEVTGSPYPGLTIAGAASWMDNEFIESDDPNVGLAIDGSTDSQYSLFVNYELQSGVLKGLGMGTTFIKVGERAFINSKDSENPYQMYLDGYHRIDMNFSYNELPNLDLSLLIRNVTDETYIETATRGGYGNFYGSPRAALFRATYRFN